MMVRLLVMHGPNLNLLGTRETGIYGHLALTELNQQLQARASGHTVNCFQSNAEATLIEKIHESKLENINCIIINPGALAHTSIALRDAFLATTMPFFEVHLTNIYAREIYRHHSYLSDIALGVVTGLGPLGYHVAIEAALTKFS